VAEATRAKDLRSEEDQKRIDLKRSRMLATAVIKRKSFSMLDAGEKDALLREVSIRLGLIDD
jgi:hypothetical protein